MATEKKFNSCVLPGVLDVCANFDLFVTEFNSDDFPTLDRPIKQTSDSLSGGKQSIPATPLENTIWFNKGDFLISCSFISFLWRCLPF